jgi:hypothetical protein
MARRSFGEEIEDVQNIAASKFLFAGWRVVGCFRGHISLRATTQRCSDIRSSR